MKYLLKYKWLIVILCIGALLRFWQLGQTPPSPDWDEAALGYNAYSILKRCFTENLPSQKEAILIANVAEQITRKVFDYNLMRLNLGKSVVKGSSVFKDISDVKNNLGPANNL